MMMNKQRGLSMPSILVIVLVVIVAARVGIALFPMYFDDRMLQQVLETIEKNGDIEGKSTNREIRNLLEERLRFNNLNIPMETLEIDRARDTITLRWPYERRDNVMSNIDLVTRFQHEVVFER